MWLSAFVSDCEAASQRGAAISLSLSLSLPLPLSSPRSSADQQHNTQQLWQELIRRHKQTFYSREGKKKKKKIQSPDTDHATILLVSKGLVCNCRVRCVNEASVAQMSWRSGSIATQMIAIFPRPSRQSKTPAFGNSANHGRYPFYNMCHVTLTSHELAELNVRTWRKQWWCEKQCPSQRPHLSLCFNFVSGKPLDVINQMLGHFPSVLAAQNQDIFYETCGQFRAVFVAPETGQNIIFSWPGQSAFLCLNLTRQWADCCNNIQL